jgi:hypothetical protein
MHMNPNDPVVTLPEAAARMGVNVRRARNILGRNVKPVRTLTGIGYRLDDVNEVRKMGR